MSFKSYRNSRSKFRCINRNHVSAQAESCELRALLSASAITVGMAEVAPCDATEGVDEAGIIDDSIPVEKMSIDELEFTGEEVLAHDFIVDENPPSEDWDPSWAYRSFVAFDGVVTDGEPTDAVAEGIDDPEVLRDESGVKVNIYHSLNPDATDEDVNADDLIALEDSPPVDGWDPAWLYRSYVGSPDGEIDDAVITDELTPENRVPVDGAEPDNPNDGIDPIIFMTFGGDVKDSDISVDDSGISVSDEVTKDLSDSPDGGVDDGLYPVDGDILLDDPAVLAEEDAVPQIRYLSLGGPEVQRTLVSSNESAAALPAIAATPAAATTPVTSAPLATNTQPSTPATNNVPVRQATSTSLFNSPRDKAVNGLALTSQSDVRPIVNTMGTKSLSMPKRSKSQLQSVSQRSDETTELDSLSPIIGDEANSPEVDSAPSQQKIESDDQVTAEPNVVSDNERVDSSSVAQSSRPSDINRPRMIDEVMSQYAENSYNA